MVQDDFASFYIPVILRPTASLISYLLKVEFATDDPAPIASPYAGEVGSLTAVQTDGSFAASGGSLAFTAQTSPAWGDLRFYGDGIARQTGRVITTRFRYTTAGQGIYLLALARVTNPSIGSGGNIEHAIAKDSGTQIKLVANAALVAAGAVFETLNSATDYPVAIVLRSAGAFYFSKLSGTWKLFWIDTISTTATVYPLFANYDGAGSLDYFNVADLFGAFTTDNGIATIDASSPSGSYTGTADQIVEMTLTAPASITTEAGFRFRVVDADNYWRMYFNTSGALRVDSVEAGVATNRKNVAGVISGGQTVTIREIMSGAPHDSYSLLAGASWVKRGSQVTNDIHATATGLATDVGAGWTAENFRSYPVESPQYTILDSV